MRHSAEEAQLIATDRIHLDLDNPRHVPYETQDEVIRYLCADEQVLQLAGDIRKDGLSPIDLFAVIPQKVGRRKSHWVAEGNRRLCALKLLNDPELAPSQNRPGFQRLAEGWTPITQVAAVVFETKEDVRLWVERAHGGTQGGIGRKPWTSEQKTRYSGSSKNYLAQAVLDYAERKEFITPEARKGKITTVARFLSNPLLRESLGLDASIPEEPARTRPEPDFDAALKQFTIDLVEGKEVTSRKNKPEIEGYSRKLSALEGVGTVRVEPHSLDSSTADVLVGGKTRKPRKPKPPKKLSYSPDVHKVLEEIPSLKLSSLYYSLCNIDVHNVTQLIAVGLWSFLETITACCGRNDRTDFSAYLSKRRLESLSVGTAHESKVMRLAIGRIADFGNTTKHHKSSAAFNAAQIINDIDTLLPLFKALARDAKGTV